jgi:hypothetical protein
MNAKEYEDRQRAQREEFGAARLNDRAASAGMRRVGEFAVKHLGLEPGDAVAIAEGVANGENWRVVAPRVEADARRASLFSRDASAAEPLKLIAPDEQPKPGEVAVPLSDLYSVEVARAVTFMANAIDPIDFSRMDVPRGNKPEDLEQAFENVDLIERSRAMLAAEREAQIAARHSTETRAGRVEAYARKVGLPEDQAKILGDSIRTGNGANVGIVQIPTRNLDGEVTYRHALATEAQPGARSISANKLDTFETKRAALTADAAGGAIFADAWASLNDPLKMTVPATDRPGAMSPETRFPAESGTNG